MQNSILVCGASFAGLSTAYWMTRLGYDVTIVEIADTFKRGGTPVNIRGKTVEIVSRMGLLDQIEANKIVMEPLDVKDAEGRGDSTTRLTRDDEDSNEDKEYEIERDMLLDIIYSAVREDVEFVFGDSIASLSQTDDGVIVAFSSGSTRSFELIIGCDGVRSSVRRLCFGEDSGFTHFLKAYGAITIVNTLLIRENTTQMYNAPGKAVILAAYNNKTDIVFVFYSEREIAYDYGNFQQKRDIVKAQFVGLGWRTQELLEVAIGSGSFYFDKLCQIKMPSWTKGRIALVGDAGYCASPAAGRGGSLAIDGAAALADAFQRCRCNYKLAFDDYNTRFRPFIEDVQAEAAEFCLQMLVPQTEDAIRARRAG